MSGERSELEDTSQQKNVRHRGTQLLGDSWKVSQSRGQSGRRDTKFTQKVPTRENSVNLFQGILEESVFKKPDSTLTLLIKSLFVTRK